MLNRAILALLRRYGPLLILAGCGAPDAPPASHTPAADMIIVGGAVYTGKGMETAQGVAVEGGRISAVGDRAAIEALRGPSSVYVDLQGAALFPGFTDAHAHLLGIGLRELTLNLEGIGSIEELTDVVSANVSETGAGETVYGRGWIETNWPEGRAPNRDDLDEVSPDNPVLLERADGHAMVVNSAALAKAGIDEKTADPAGGLIERDGNGRPTGVLIDNAQNLVAGLIESPSADTRREAFEVGAEVYARYGWTGVHNMSVDSRDVPLMEELAGASSQTAGHARLPIRVYNALDASGLDWLESNAPHTDKTGRIVTRALKLYADGALGSRGAALSEPYSDRPDTSGLLLMEAPQALEMMKRAHKAGVQVAAHAIGDRGNRLVLDWFEQTLPEADRASARWRVEHAQILHTEDIPRFARLGAIASMQPSHAIGDLFFAPARLGSARLDGAYAWRSLLDSGAVIAGGSDAPVERGDPLIEFYAAVARRSLEGFSNEDWRADQAVSRAEALAMFTSAPAFASFAEDRLGAIEVGKAADFTAFSADIMTIPPEEILRAKAVLTVVDGKIIYDGRGRSPEE